MTFDERVQALAPLGFSPRQTRFLVTVALHSGYCLRRQYASSAGVAYGKNVRAFLDTLVDRRLVSRFTYRANRGHLYHLYARSIYRALGQEDDRHRRHTSPATVARRLMLLDTVLAEPRTEWLATEADKVDYFTQVCRIPTADLPRTTPSPEPDADTRTTRTLARPPRYFGHKLPIGLENQLPPHSVANERAALSGNPFRFALDNSSGGRWAGQRRVQLVYLATEPGAATFERFLRDHAALLRALPTWTVVLVHAQPGAASAPWEATFRRVMDATVRLGSHAARALERYLVARRAVEQQEFGRVSVADLQSYRAATLRFAEPVVDALYRAWLATGDLRVDPALLLAALPRPGQLVVRTLPYRYDQFGHFAGVL